MLEMADAKHTMPPIHVDREGQWQWEGHPMVHERIVRYLKQHLEQDDEGHYWITVGAARVPVLVADAPYVIEGISLAERSLMLDDGTEESFAPPLTLHSSSDHRLYAPVKNGRHRALLSRAMHQLVWDGLEEEGGAMRLRSGEHVLPVDIRPV